MLNFQRHEIGKSEWVFLGIVVSEPERLRAANRWVRVDIDEVTGDEPGKQPQQVTHDDDVTSRHLPEWLKRSRRNIARFSSSLNELKDGVSRLKVGIAALNEKAQQTASDRDNLAALQESDARMRALLRSRSTSLTLSLQSSASAMAPLWQASIASFGVCGGITGGDGLQRLASTYRGTEVALHPSKQAALAHSWRGARASQELQDHHDASKSSGSLAVRDRRKSAGSSRCTSMPAVQKGAVASSEADGAAPHHDSRAHRGFHVGLLVALEACRSLAARLNRALDDAADRAWHRASSILQGSSNVSYRPRAVAHGPFSGGRRSRAAKSSVFHDLSSSRLHRGLEGACIVCECAARSALEYRAEASHPRLSASTAAAGATASGRTTARRSLQQASFASRTWIARLDQMELNRALYAALQEDQSQYVELAAHAMANLIAARTHHAEAQRIMQQPDWVAGKRDHSYGLAGGDAPGKLRDHKLESHTTGTQSTSRGGSATRRSVPGMARRLRDLVPIASKSTQALPAMHSARALCSLLLQDADPVIAPVQDYMMRHLLGPQPPVGLLDLSVARHASSPLPDNHIHLPALHQSDPAVPRPVQSLQRARVCAQHVEYPQVAVLWPNPGTSEGGQHEHTKAIVPGGDVSPRTGGSVSRMLFAARIQAASSSSAAQLPQNPLIDGLVDPAGSPAASELPHMDTWVGSMASWSGAAQPQMLLRVGLFPDGVVCGYGACSDGQHVLVGGRMQVSSAAGQAAGRLHVTYMKKRRVGSETCMDGRQGGATGSASTRWPEMHQLSSPRVEPDDTSGSIDMSAVPHTALGLLHRLNAAGGVHGVIEEMERESAHLVLLGYSCGYRLRAGAAGRHVDIPWPNGGVFGTWEVARSKGGGGSSAMSRSPSRGCAPLGAGAAPGSASLPPVGGAATGSTSQHQTVPSRDRREAVRGAGGVFRLTVLPGQTG